MTHQGTDRLVVERVEPGARVHGVGEDDADQVLGDGPDSVVVARFARPQVRLEERDGEGGGIAQDEVESVERELREQQTRLHLDQRLQRPVGAEELHARREADSEELFEIIDLGERGAELSVEPVDLGHQDRLEQHLSPTGKRSVDRRPGHAGLAGDVVERGLGEAETCDAGERGGVDARLGAVGCRRCGPFRVDRQDRPHVSETVRPKPSHRPGDIGHPRRESDHARQDPGAHHLVDRRGIVEVPTPRCPDV